jgi:hypothetical protein
MKKDNVNKAGKQSKAPVSAKKAKSKPGKNKNTSEGQDEIPSIH